MTTPDPFDAHRAAFGRSLQAAARRKRARTRKLRAVSGATLLAAAAISVTAIALPSVGKLDPIQEAGAALAAPDTILHYVVSFSMTTGDPPASPKGHFQRFEIWRATSSPTLWRQRLSPDRPLMHHLSSSGRLLVGSAEIAHADGVRTTYDPAGPWMEIVTGQPREAAYLPGFEPGRPTDGQQSEDPVTLVRAMLVSGKLQDLGVITNADGRRVRRLATSQPRRVGDATRPAPKLEYQVDAKTYDPVTIINRMRMTIPRHNGPQRYQESVFTTSFVTFERIAVTPTTAKLLTIQPAAGTKITRMTSQQERRQFGRRLLPARLSAAR